MFSCTWGLGFYVLSDRTHKNLGIVDSLSYKLWEQSRYLSVYFLGALMTSSIMIAIVLIWINSRIGLSHPFFVYFPGAFKLVFRLAYVGISYTYIFNKAIHMCYLLLFRHICWCIWDQHPHICISLLFLFTEYMLW